MRASSRLGLMVPEIHLFHSRKRCTRYLRRRFGDCEMYDTPGQMWYQDGVAVVLMTHSGRPTTEQSLLVHEAYHVAVAHMEFLGEDDAGEETMAYLLQTISDALFGAHERWRRRHRG